MGRLVVVVILALWLGGCGGVAARVDEKAEAKLAEWHAAHPGEEPSEEVTKRIWAEAKAEIMQELAEKGQGFITSVLTGNWAGAAFSLFGLAGIFFGTRKKPAIVKPVSGGVA